MPSLSLIKVVNYSSRCKAILFVLLLEMEASREGGGYRALVSTQMVVRQGFSAVESAVSPGDGECSASATGRWRNSAKRRPHSKDGGGGGRHMVWGWKEWGGVG